MTLCCVFIQELELARSCYSRSFQNGCWYCNAPGWAHVLWASLPRWQSIHRCKYFPYNYMYYKEFSQCCPGVLHEDLAGTLCLHARLVNLGWLLCKCVNVCKVYINLFFSLLEFVWWEIYCLKVLLRPLQVTLVLLLISAGWTFQNPADSRQSDGSMHLIIPGVGL